VTRSLDCLRYFRAPFGTSPARRGLAAALGLAGGLGVAAPGAALAASVAIPPTGQFGDFTPGPGGDVFALDAANFGVTDPLSFQSGVFGNPGLSDVGADDGATIDPGVNVIVIQNHDNNDADSIPPANWDASWNARTSLQAIAANTEGDRPGFFLYWNEGLGVNRLFATDNLNNPDGSLTRLFTDQSANLTGVPGDVDLDLSDGTAMTALFPEANANLFELAEYGAENFAFADQAAAIPVPPALPLLGAALAGLAFLGRRRGDRA